MKITEKNFKKFRKGPVLIAAVFLLLACAAFYYEFQKIKENKTLAGETMRTWEAEENRRNELKSLEVFLENTQDKRAALDSHFGQSSNVVPFLDSLEDLGRAAGASPEVLSVEESKDKTSLLVSIRALGSFESVYKFLELLENSAYELDFEAMDLNKIGESGTAEWEGLFRLKLLTFIP
jgi:hypothetical protein